MASFCILSDRAALAVGGPEAAHFLQALVTADLTPAIAGQAAAFAALLTPQGKILFDFLVLPAADGFVLDCAAGEAAALLKRLTLYRLRARVTLAALPEVRAVAVWGAALPPLPGLYADPRLAALGGRAMVPAAGGAFTAALEAAGFAPAGEAAYHAHRVGLGVPEGGHDFAFGTVFPHDVDMDCLAGVAFDKGCYVGQEVVARMEHRGTARRRTVLAEGEGALPAAGTEIVAGDRAIGTLGSVAGRHGLAMVRTDRAGEAMAAGVPLTAGGIALRLALPSFARFGWPAAQSAD